MNTDPINHDIAIQSSDITFSSNTLWSIALSVIGFLSIFGKMVIRATCGEMIKEHQKEINNLMIENKKEIEKQFDDRLKPVTDDVRIIKEYFLNHKRT